jgi:AraC-like DNA-binding protein
MIITYDPKHLAQPSTTEFPNNMSGNRLPNSSAWDYTTFPEGAALLQQILLNGINIWDYRLICPPGHTIHSRITMQKNRILLVVYLKGNIKARIQPYNTLHFKKAGFFIIYIAAGEKSPVIFEGDTHALIFEITEDMLNELIFSHACFALLKKCSEQQSPLALSLLDSSLSQETLDTIDKLLLNNVLPGSPPGVHCNNIICTLLQDYLKCISRNDPKIKDCVQRILDYMEITIYIYNNPTEDLRQSTLCEKFIRSPKQMLKLIREMANQTLIGLTISLKLLRSEKCLVEEPDLSIQQIHKTCGFNNRQNYNDHFGKKNKITPEKFRELKGVLPHE